MTAAERIAEIRQRERNWRSLGSRAADDIQWLLSRLAAAERVVEAARTFAVQYQPVVLAQELVDALAAYDADSP